MAFEELKQRQSVMWGNGTYRTSLKQLLTSMLS